MRNSRLLAIVECVLLKWKILTNPLHLVPGECTIKGSFSAGMGGTTTVHTCADGRQKAITIDERNVQLQWRALPVACAGISSVIVRSSEQPCAKLRSAFWQADCPENVGPVVIDLLQDAIQGPSPDLPLCERLVRLLLRTGDAATRWRSVKLLDRIVSAELGSSADALKAACRAGVCQIFFAQLTEPGEQRLLLAHQLHRYCVQPEPVAPCQSLLFAS